MIKSVVRYMTCGFTFHKLHWQQYSYVNLFIQIILPECQCLTHAQFDGSYQFSETSIRHHTCCLHNNINMSINLCLIEFHFRHHFFHEVFVCSCQLIKQCIISTVGILCVHMNEIAKYIDSCEVIGTAHQNLLSSCNNLQSILDASNWEIPDKAKSCFPSLISHSMHDIFRIMKLIIIVRMQKTSYWGTTVHFFIICWYVFVDVVTDVKVFAAIFTSWLNKLRSSKMRYYILFSHPFY